MNSPIVQKVEDFVKEQFQEQIPPEYSYHNFLHTTKVKEAIDELIHKANIAESDAEPLIIATYFHDIGFCRSDKNHEEHSKQIAREFLETQNYPSANIDKVVQYIEATRIDYEPNDYLEGMIRDADLSNLAEEDYFEISGKLRQEWEFLNGKPYTDKEWNDINYHFMKNHRYHTEEAKALFGENKEKNMALLEAIRSANSTIPKKKKKKKKKKKTNVGRTISSNKSAQTQFKTSLRNHIDLSAIADNKANIMLSVNALIITVALPVIASQVLSNKYLLVPAIMLLAICVTSMIYATLATRPIKMSGVVTKEDIDAKRSNLFFFGNFYRMSFDDYESGIGKVLSDTSMLDNSITRDLFFLGKALGSKYRNLRLCYNIFMFGMISVVIAFTIAFVLTSIYG